MASTGAPTRKNLIIYLIAVTILSILTIIIYYYYFYRPLAITTEKIELTAFNVNAVVKSGCEVIIANKDTTFGIGPFGVNLIPPSAADRCREVLSG